MLPDVYGIAHSPLLSGAPFDALLEFFGALVQADMQIATHVVPNLVIAVERAPKAEASLTNVAKCVGQVVNSQRGIAAGTIAEFGRHLKVRVGVEMVVIEKVADMCLDIQPSSKAKTPQVVLSLLVMGEVGRFM